MCPFSSHYDAQVCTWFFIGPPQPSDSDRPRRTRRRLPLALIPTREEGSITNGPHRSYVGNHEPPLGFGKPLRRSSEEDGSRVSGQATDPSADKPMVEKPSTFANGLQQIVLPYGCETFPQISWRTTPPVRQRPTPTQHVPDRFRSPVVYQASAGTIGCDVPSEHREKDREIKGLLSRKREKREGIREKNHNGDSISDVRSPSSSKRYTTGRDAGGVRWINGGPGRGRVVSKF
ncbi:unnamed protein product, partial [Iphiclides podalirius]